MSQLASACASRVDVYYQDFHGREEAVVGVPFDGARSTGGVL